jgi:hypothetical protein
VAALDPLQVETASCLELMRSLRQAAGHCLIRPKRMDGPGVPALGIALTGEWSNAHFAAVTTGW